MPDSSGGLGHLDGLFSGHHSRTELLNLGLGESQP
jgi:hypothetical protein